MRSNVCVRSLRIGTIVCALSTWGIGGSASAAIIDVPGDQPTLKAAVATARTGDVVVFAPGVYDGGVFVDNKALTLTSRFHTTGDTSYVAQTVISGNPSYCSGHSGCRGDAVLEFGSNAHGSAVVGLTVTGAEKGIRSRSFVDITRCRVVGTKDGTNYNSGAGGTFSHNLFANNTDDGIDLNGDVVVRVVDNIIRDNRDDGIEFRLNPYDGPMATSVFARNRITGNGEDGIQFIDYSDASHRILRVEHNVFAHNAMAGVGILDGGRTAEDFSGPQIPERVLLINNTFIGEHYGFVGGGNVIALNNVFAGTRQSALRRVGSASIASYNLFWNNGSDYESSNVDLAHTVRADPLLDPEGFPMAGSGAIDAGIAFFQWAGETVLDLDATAYSGVAPDLGAFEVGSSTGVPALVIGDVTVPEGNRGSATASFTVRLSSATDQDVSVDFETADASATTADGDYMAAAGRLTIPANDGSGTIDVTVYGDETPEADETFLVRLSNPANAALARQTATCTILNDDVVPTVETRIASGSDDVEERASGSVSLSSSDLELMVDGSPQRAVGLRFTGLMIPAGARVTSAWIQFQADESHAEPTTLLLRAQAADDAPPFRSGSGDVSARELTGERVEWRDVPAWTAGEAGAGQRTPDLSGVVQAVVGRTGWRSGNALVIVVTGTGHRTAEAYEGSAAGAALLHVEYVLAGGRLAPLKASADADAQALPGVLRARVAPQPARRPLRLLVDLPRAGPLHIEVFDVLGRRVDPPLDLELEAGRHVVDLHGSSRAERDFGPGVYFYRLLAAGGSVSGRFVVLE